MFPTATPYSISLPEVAKLDIGKFNEKQIDSTLAQTMAADWESIAPQLQQLFSAQSSMLGQTNTLTTARQDAANILGRTNAIQSRQLAQANVNLSPSQRRAMALKNQLSASGTGNAMINNAVSQRYDQNNQARSNLLASVNAMKQGAQGNLTQIVGNQMDRDQAYRDANANRRNAMLGGLSGLMSIGLSGLY